jgi:hypothetical protein
MNPDEVLAELKTQSDLQILFGYFRKNARTISDPMTLKDRHYIKMPDSENCICDDCSLNLFKRFIEIIHS